MRVDLFDFELPEALIAERPTEARDGARLLHVASEGLHDRMVVDLPDLVPEGSLLVVNDTRVIPARLHGKKATGGAVELLLVRALDGEGRWHALGKSSKGLRPGMVVRVGVGDGVDAEVLEVHEGGLHTVHLRAQDGGDLMQAVERHGHVPLPPYVRRGDDRADRERYQTIFAARPGAVAAPTAGLHLTPALLERLGARGVRVARVTLHVGLGTFKPVTVADLDDHPMHAESIEVRPEVAAEVAAARERGCKVVAVGTTAVRTLESAADGNGGVVPSVRDTSLLIQPGYRFKVVDALLTNFHLPRSTLLALVSAFAGRSRVLAAYAHAIEQRYRFYSYGDAMFISDRIDEGRAAQ